MSTRSHLIIKEGHLCPTCRFVFSLTPTPDSGSDRGMHACYNINSTLLELRRSRDSGCYFCNLLLRGLGKKAHDNLPQFEITYEISLPEPGWSGGLQFSMYVLEEVGSKHMAHVYFNSQSPDENAELKEPVQVLGTTTGSEETMEFIRQKLKQCDSHHSLCTTSKPSSTWYPTRLLDVDLQEHGSPRLILTSQTPISGAYTTLSHCWGGFKPLSLSTHNLDQFLQGIGNKEIPKTFLDAFEVSRALGIRYIWIDAMCIIQDSTDDWNHEAGLMFKVYQHAYCNIAATESPNSNTGLFRARSPKAMSLTLQVQYDTCAGSFQFTRGEKWGSESLDAPLNLRAWVVQERYISTRIINFGSDQVVWDCYESLASEQYPERLPSNIRSFKRNHGLLSTVFSDFDFLKKWCIIVQQYSVSRLTFPEKDRIVAISSLAEYLQDIWKIEYCAGLWQKHIEIQLDWCPWEQIVEKSYGKSLAPSWSWLSFNGGGVELGVPTWDLSSLELLANVVDIYVRQEISAAGNRILRGHLDIRCVLLPLLHKDSTLNPWQWVAVQNSGRIACELSLDYPEDDYSDLYFLALYGYLHYGKDEVRGIVVTPSSEGEGHYIRCGSCSTTDFTSYDDFRKVVENNSIPCLEFDKDKGYLIRLV